MRERRFKMLIWKLIRTIILLFLSLYIPLTLLDNGQIVLCLLAMLLLNGYTFVSILGFYKTTKEQN